MTKSGARARIEEIYGFFFQAPPNRTRPNSVILWMEMVFPLRPNHAFKFSLFPNLQQWIHRRPAFLDQSTSKMGGPLRTERETYKQTNRLCLLGGRNTKKIKKNLKGLTVPMRKLRDELNAVFFSSLLFFFGEIA